MSRLIPSKGAVKEGGRSGEDAKFGKGDKERKEGEM